MPVTTLKVARNLDVPRSMKQVPDGLPITPVFRLPVPGAILEGGAMNLATALDLLEAWVSGLTAPKLGLYTNVIAPGPSTLLADLIQPAASWYALHVIVPSAIFVNADGSISFDAPSFTWIYSGVSAEEVVKGWFIQDTV